MSSQQPPTTSKRRSLIESASKKFSFIDRPRSRKERLSDNDGTLAMKISSPFDFRDISKSSLSSGESDGNAKTTPCPKIEYPERDSVTSPLEKPLPSLPFATMTSNSPVRVKRSIIDAQEQPLRRSLSPQQQAFEDWPSLSPDKGRATESTKYASSPIKPSISNSMAERINRFSIEDDRDDDDYTNTKNPFALTKSRFDNTSFPTHSTTTKSGETAKPAVHSLRSPAPYIRQTRTSEMRLRMSTSAEDHRHSKSNLPSPLSTTSGNVTTRSRPRKRRPQPLYGNALTSHSRSRSRHRVTPQGSPYSLPAGGAVLPGRGNETPLMLDPNKVDTDFMHAADGTEYPETPQIQQNIDVVASDQCISAALNSKGLPQSSSDYHGQSDVKDDHEFDASQEESGNQNFTEPASPFEDNQDHNGETLLHRTTASTEPEADADGQIAAQNIIASYSLEKSDNVGESRVEQSSYRNEPNGPTLNIPADAENLISDANCDQIDCSNLATDAGADVTDKETSHALYHTQPIDQTPCKAQRRVSGTVLPFRDSILINQEQLERKSSADSRSTLREPPPVRNVSATQRNIMHATTTSAPPVKPGVPKDNTRTKAWPFAESAIAPFKTSSTPQHTIGKAHSTSTESNRDSSNSSQAEPSPGRSDRSKYDIGEALHKIEPRDEMSMSKSVPSNSSGAIPPLLNAKTDTSVFPARTSSRYTASARATGRRIQEVKSMSGFSNIGTPPPRNPLRNASNSTPRSTSFKGIEAIRSGITKASSSQSSPDILSPSSTTNTSTSKGVLNNIRGLFHKHSNLHLGMHSSLHLPKRTQRNPAPQPTTSPIPPQIQTARSTSRLPRSPQVKGTSALAGSTTNAHKTRKLFPSNPSVRPLSTITTTPASPTKQLLPEDAGTRIIDKKLPTTTPSKSTPPTSLEPTEVQSATALVHRLLELVQQDKTATMKKEQLLKLSTLLVSTLTAARDAEAALEQANMAAARCEMHCVEVRKRVGEVEALVRSVVFDGGEDEDAAGL
ncbi:hypothetical protein R6Q59_010203 [Mikania micrantha]